MKTEEEARKCWCPYYGIKMTFWQWVRYQFGASKPHGILWHCNASECMAWRWAQEKETEAQDYKRGDASEAYGYCGLAGKP